MEKKKQLKDAEVGAAVTQRRRDDNKNNIFASRGGRTLGAERKIVQNAVFRGETPRQ